MERKNVWKTYDDKDVEQLNQLADGYIDFISECKTEREFAARAIAEAEKAGYMSIEVARESGVRLVAGSKVYASNHGKGIIMVQLGKKPLEQGFNILGAHIDSPRLDIKQNPLYEASDFALLDTHYYGGIKKYQWVTMPLAIHGVVAKKDGSVVGVNVGEDPADPVFCVTDLLIHLARQQMDKKAAEAVEGEALDLLVGNRPLVIEKNEARDGSDKDAAEDGRPAFEKLAEK